MFVFSRVLAFPSFPLSLASLPNDSPFVFSPARLFCRSNECWHQLETTSPQNTHTWRLFQTHTSLQCPRYNTASSRSVLPFWRDEIKGKSCSFPLFDYLIKGNSPTRNPPLWGVFEGQSDREWRAGGGDRQPQTSRVNMLGWNSDTPSGPPPRQSLAAWRRSL